MLAFSIQYRSGSGWARCGSSGMFLFFGDGELIMTEAIWLLFDAPRDKCAHFREINGIAAAFQHLQKNYIPAALSFL